jgi:phage terminase small subunit
LTSTMSAKSTDTKIKQFSNAMTNAALQARTKIKQLSEAMSATVPDPLTEQAQLQVFIYRAHEAKIHTPEAGHGDAWEILGGKKAKKAQDDDEWVVVENETDGIAEMP